MKHIGIFLFIIIFLYSCAGYRTTKFSDNTIALGMSKEFVLKKFGSPFKTDIYRESENLFELIYYKEAVDVTSYTYILTSILTFKNSILINIEQTEEYLPDIPNIKIQSL